MGRLEDLAKGARVGGIAPIGVVTVIDVEWVGADAVNLTYEDDSGNVQREIVYRSKEAELSLDSGGRPWLFDADPELFTLVAEAKRISLAHLFDPYLATYTSDVGPIGRGRAGPSRYDSGRQPQHRPAGPGSRRLSPV